MLRLLSHAKFVALACALAMCAMLVAFRSAPANDQKELKAQAEALLAKSRDLSNIEAPGSPAFVLNAKIHYQIGTQSAEGDGQIIWTAPDHYREAFTAPNYSYTEVVRDGYRYLARTNNEMPLISYELQKTIELAMHPGLIVKNKIKTGEVTHPGEGGLTCIAFKTVLAISECLDGSGDVVTTEIDRPPDASALNDRREYRDFVAFGTKRFPNTIVFRGGDGHIIEVDVQQLALVKEVSSDAFKTQADATKEAWCAQPKSDVLLDPSMNPYASLARIDPKALVYCVIDGNGHARSVTVIRSSKPIKDKDIETWMRRMRFPSLRCGSEGIEYQFVIDASFVPELIN